MNTMAGLHENTTVQPAPILPGGHAARCEAARRKTLREHIWGPTGSLVLHLGILVILLHLVMGGAVTPPPNLPPVRPSPEPDFNPDPSTSIPDPTDPKQKPDLPDPNPIPAPGAVDPAEVANAIQPPGIDSPLPSIDLPGLGPQLPLRGWPDRTPATARRRGDEFLPGGGHGTNDARIVRALEWLRDHQQPDGSWGTGEGTGGHRVAMTGVALLAFLAHGETPQSRAFGATVDRALRWLVAQQREDGAFLRLDGHPAVYEQGIATYAIAEAYSLIRAVELRGVMERAVARIVSGQQDTGAFTYEYAMNGRRDTSVTGWQAQALIAARIAQAEAAGLEEALAGCVQALKLNYDGATGRFRYAPEDGRAGGHTTPACTGIGVLSLQLLGHAADPEVRGGVAALQTTPVAWTTSDLGDWPVYAWYYINQAKFHQSRREWDVWSPPFYRAMWAAQNPDGSWTPAGQGEKTHGRVYGTAFTALNLLVYYRHLPTYGRTEPGRDVAPVLWLPPPGDGPVVDIGG